MPKNVSGEDYGRSAAEFAERLAHADGTALTGVDPWLAPYAPALRHRFGRYRGARERIINGAGSLADFANAHRVLGFNRGEYGGETGVWFREWAPAAIAISLTGDFNDWDRMSDPLHKGADGIWSRFLSDEKYADRLKHGSRIKLHVHTALGQNDRIPAYIRRAVFDPNSNDFAGQFWEPPEPYTWRCDVPRSAGNLRIYEAHVGMASEEERVGTYREFAGQVIPRIARGGYNAVQLMAIQEHPYYGSFGYQVSNFFAPSSRFGTPEELKELVDTAHEHGLLVLLDLVHSHAVRNINEGLNRFDGTDYQYFHAGDRGSHPSWDSLLFDYGKWQVLQFLLSNVRYWLEEFRFDGFRFDGVTSMLYLDHGLGHAFLSYDDYLPPHVDEDAITYLQLANELAHTIRPGAVTVAEDVSGMIGIARPLEEGGLGFDYRLAMGIPDYWIKLLKDQSDEQWSMSQLWHTLVNRRFGENHVAYAESHDQALVGDKTLAMWLMDADMYWFMNKASQNLRIERGIALHKMIRLLTFAAGGEAYLNFMGNEFGHPEWIDFPREGNQYSYKYARRQWSLVDHPELRYGDLAAFDQAMQQLDVDFGLLTLWPLDLLHLHEDGKRLVFRRGPLVLAFNFHHSDSQVGYRVGVPEGTDYRLRLCTDDAAFDGHGTVAPDQLFPRQEIPWDNQMQSVQIYLPARTALVLAPAKTE